MPADTTTNKRFLGLAGTQALVAEIKKRISISVLTTKGDILYASASQSTSNGTTTPASLSRLAIGTTGQVLKVSNGVPVWGTDNDSNVKQEASSATGQFPVLLKGNTDSSTLNAGQTYFNSNVKIQPSTGTITASNFSGNGSNITNLNASSLATGTVSTARLPSATASSNGTGGSAGIVSATDMEHLETMWNLWSADGTGDTLVNKVQEVLNAFANFPEADNLVTVLAAKANTTDIANTYLPKVGATGLSNDFELGVTGSNKGIELTTSSGAIVLETNNSNAPINLRAGGALFLVSNKGAAASEYYGVNLDTSNVSDSNKTISFPNASGTIALQSWVSGSYVPYSGATGNVDLNQHDLEGVATVHNSGDLTIGATYDVFLYASEGYVNMPATFKVGSNLYLQSNAASSDKTIVFPNTSGTVILDSGTNTFTSTNTFKDNLIIANSSGTTVAKLNSTGITISGLNTTDFPSRTENGISLSAGQALLTWEELSLISNGEIAAADVQAMF